MTAKTVQQAPSHTALGAAFYRAMAHRDATADGIGSDHLAWTFLSGTHRFLVHFGWIRRAILRRTEKGREPESTLLEVDALRASTTERRIEYSGEELKLTTSEFNVLLVLMRHAGEVVNKELICQQALGRALTPYDRSVDVHVSNLRKKLGGTELIKNVRGVGYQLVRAGVEVTPQ